MTYLLIIDSQVKEDAVQILSDSKKDNVLLMAYDSSVTDTSEKFLEKLNKFVSDNSISPNSLESIGWGFHGYRNLGEFSIFKNSPIINYEQPQLQEDGTFIFSDTLPKPDEADHILPLIQRMKELLVPDAGRIDFFLCNICIHIASYHCHIISYGSIKKGTEHRIR